MCCNLESSGCAAGAWSEQIVQLASKRLTSSTGMHHGGDWHALALAIQLVARQRMLEIELNEAEEQIFPGGLHFNYYATALESTSLGRRHCFELVLSCIEGIVREVLAFHVDVGPGRAITVSPEDPRQFSRYYRSKTLLAFCGNVQFDLNRGCRPGERHQLVL